MHAERLESTGKAQQLLEAIVKQTNARSRLSHNQLIVKKLSV